MGEQQEPSKLASLGKRLGKAGKDAMEARDEGRYAALVEALRDPESEVALAVRDIVRTEISHVTSSLQGAVSQQLNDFVAGFEEASAHSADTNEDDSPAAHPDA